MGVHLWGHGLLDMALWCPAVGYVVLGFGKKVTIYGKD